MCFEFQSVKIIRFQALNLNEQIFLIFYFTKQLQYEGLDCYTKCSQPRSLSRSTNRWMNIPREIFEEGLHIVKCDLIKQGETIISWHDKNSKGFTC